MVIALKEEGTRAVVESSGTTDDWNEFVNAVPENDPRIMIYDFMFKHKDGRQISKMLYFMYCPDTCTDTKTKFHIANSSMAIKAVCNPINCELQRNDKADLTYEKTLDSL